MTGSSQRARSSAAGTRSGHDVVEAEAATSTPGFAVQLANFSGPFDLLLNLISRRELDITEIALAQVTDEFMAHIRRMQEIQGQFKLDDVSEFLVVAATLLDLKAARLLPAGTGAVEDEADIALLEARDLLFARLLQYRAFKDMARELSHRFAEEADSYPRDVPPESGVTALLPELRWSSTPEEFAALAARVLAGYTERPAGVELGHLVAPTVSVREQSDLLQELLRARGTLTFSQLTEDAEAPAVLVARFLALLELFRDGVVSFEQTIPLGELLVLLSADDD